MPECQNCGSLVTPAHVQVSTPDGMENPCVCLNCEDMIRDDAQVRAAHSPGNY